MCIVIGQNRDDYKSTKVTMQKKVSDFLTVNFKPLKLSGCWNAGFIGSKKCSMTVLIFIKYLKSWVK